MLEYIFNKLVLQSYIPPSYMQEALQSNDSNTELIRRENNKFDW